MSKQTYQDRNKILRDMGYKNYQEYIDSDLWKSIREKVYKMKGSECILCGNTATHIHHRGYGKDTLSGKDISALVPICGNCHQKVEYKQSGVKRSLVETQTRFDMICKGVRRNKVGKKRIKRMLQCCGLNCQNIRSKKKMYCDKCEDQDRQVREMVRFLRSGKKWLKGT